MPYELAEVVSSGALPYRTGFEAYIRQLNIYLSVSSYLYQPYVAEKKMSHAKIDPLAEAMPRNFLILLLNAWVRVQITYHPHSVVRNQSTGSLKTMNVCS
jgi:hypothetical protein